MKTRADRRVALDGARSTAPCLPQYSAFMGGSRAGELVLIPVVLFFLGYGLALPIVGIVMAAAKKRRGVRATGAVIWSSINLGLFGLGPVMGIVARIPPIGPAIGLALNGVWLSLALQANRAAAARPPQIVP